MLRIKLVRSPIGNTAQNRKTIVALGLRKMHQTVEHEDTASIRGMVHRVKHLLEVEILDQPLVKPQKKQASAKATPAEAAPASEAPAKPARAPRKKAEAAVAEGQE
jgi:large subunit ribosomal protein L30